MRANHGRAWDVTAQTGTDGFSILVPENWFTLTSDQLAILMDNPAGLGLEDSVPDEIIQQWSALLRQGAKLISADPNSDWNDFATTLNLYTAPTGQSAETMLRLSLEELDKAGGEAVRSAILDLPAGPAYELVYNMPEFGFEGWLIHIIVDGEQWMLSVGAQELDDVAVDLLTVASSLQLTD